MYCAGHYARIHHAGPSEQRACSWLPPAVHCYAQGAAATAAAALTNCFGMQSCLFCYMRSDGQVWVRNALLDMGAAYRPTC